MVISSLVVDTISDSTQAVAEQLPLLNSAIEVHEVVDYKVVITIEAETVDESHAIASSIVTVPGVLNVNLVYCNFEDDPSL